jgi:hypothetical protein
MTLKAIRLQMMMELRRRLIDGEDNDTIMQALKLNRRTYFRLKSRMLEHDRRILEKENYDELMNQTVLLKERYQRIYQKLQSIADNSQEAAEDRMEALKGMSTLATMILRIYRDSPGLSVVQQRKLQALKKGSLDLGHGLHLPPALFDWGGNPTDNSATAEQQQQQRNEEEQARVIRASEERQEQEQQEGGNGQYGTTRRDWWVSPRGSD